MKSGKNFTVLQYMLVGDNLILEIYLVSSTKRCKQDQINEKRTNIRFDGKDTSFLLHPKKRQEVFVMDAKIGLCIFP